MQGSRFKSEEKEGKKWLSLLVPLLYMRKTGGETIIRSGYYATLGDYATRVDPLRIAGKV